eukprot:1844486-Karenia_brevis.AAC.1
MLAASSIQPARPDKEANGQAWILSPAPYPVIVELWLFDFLFPRQALGYYVASSGHQPAD